MPKKTRKIHKSKSQWIKVFWIPVSVVAIGAIITGIFSLISNKTTINKDNTSQSIEGTNNISVQHSPNTTIVVESNPDTEIQWVVKKPLQPPLPPPENFPERESFGLDSLTDEERLSLDYLNTVTEILNNTDKSIRVAYSFIPLKSSTLQSSMSQYAHHVTREILPGELLEDIRKNFWGPVHLSIYSNNIWHAMNEWVDLKIVSRRSIDVIEENGAFSCVVKFEGPEQ